MLAHTLTHHIAGKSVEVHGGEHSLESLLRMLRHHSRDHTSQDISCTACSHPRIARRIDPGLGVRLHHQRAMPFEHYYQLVFARELPGYSEAIILDVGDTTSGQTRHLTRMRRDHK